VSQINLFLSQIKQPSSNAFVISIVYQKYGPKSGKGKYSGALSSN
jgi:hypothetical protein